MSDVVVAPYGSWTSPFPITLLTEGTLRLAEPDADGETIWWIEGRPENDGRSTLVRRFADGSTSDVSPPSMNVRDRAHEYGGAAWLARGSLVVVSSFADGRLYRLDPDGRAEPSPITEAGALRYADLQRDEVRNRVICVREDHTGTGEAVNTIVGVSLADGATTVLVQGADFYGSPRLSPDGRQLCWLEWNHPNLPWDGTTLRVAPIAEDGSIGDARRVAGGPSDWISQPRWSPGGVLHFVAEPSGWMNLHRVSGDRTEPLGAVDAEFAPPDWQFGYRSYAFRDDGSIVGVGRSAGRDRLYVVGPEVGAVREVDLPFTEMEDVSIDASGGVVFRAASPTESLAIVRLDLESGTVERLRLSTTWQPDPADLSTAEPIEFATIDGGRAYGIFYPPHSRRYRAPDGELPPLIVTSHGGPTSAASTALSATHQLFASRGIAVLDVDYGGSTGYGKAYRKRLEGQWGVVDVDDCVAGARFLADQGRVDPKRLAVRGGSSSGYTTLAALAFRDTFAAGISYFGIGDLEAFVRETHKFESRYVDRLIGPWPETQATYRARSPSRHADQITVPALILQGLDDRVVPPSEAERIVDALWERRVPHAYVPFEGEDHGFRKRASIIRSMEAELSFLGQVFGFTPADRMEPVAIEHLDEWRARRAEAAAT